MPRTDLYVNLSITGELAPFRIIGFACKAATDAGEIIDYQFAPGFLATAGA